MTQLPPGAVLFTAEEIDEAAHEDLVVTMTLSARDSAAVGRFLDLIEHAARLGEIMCDLAVPGYHQVFYGYEKELTGEG